MGLSGTNLKQAVRSLARAPGFTLVMILILGLGIGATSATFTLVDVALLRPLPYPQADRLALIFEGIPKANLPQIPFSAPDLLDYRQMQRSFSALAAFKTREFELSGGEPERVTGAKVSPDLFGVLGVSAAHGRFFLPDEDAPGQLVAVLSHGFWQRRFGGRPDVLGQPLVLDREPYTIVGIAPAGLVFPDPGLRAAGYVEPADLFVPLAFTPLERESRGSMFNNLVLGRLAPGQSVEDATTEAGVLARRIQANYPAVLRDGPYQLELAVSDFRSVVTGAVERPLLVLLGAVGLVLLVTCANAANLALARAASRRRELAVRAALGAGRARLLQVLLTESAVLAVLSGTLGLVLGHWAVRAARLLAPDALPLPQDLPLNGAVLAFTAGVTILTTGLFGLAPLASTRNLNVEAALRETAGRTTADPGRLRVQRTLAGATAALAVILLVGAGLLVRSFDRLMRTDAGFRPEGVLTLSVTLPNVAYAEPSRTKAFVRTLTDDLRSLPGVEAASVSTAVPLLIRERRAFAPEQTPASAAPESVTATWTHGAFFEAQGIALRNGRTFDSRDAAGGQLVVIVSQALAARYWPGQDAVGKRLKWGVPESETPWMTVVGVVADVADGPLGTPPNAHVYAPYEQIDDREFADAATAGSSFHRAVILSVRSALPPADLTASAIARLRMLDPSLPVTDVVTMAERVSTSVAPQRFSATLLGSFALSALLLAAVGLYGVLALAVTQRTRELGVRLALGATRREVIWLVVGQGMLVVLGGVAVGLLGAIALSRSLASILHETTAYDPLAFTLAPAVLVATALVASLLPAWRASRVDPMLALRVE